MMIKRSLLITVLAGILILLSACGSAQVEAKPATEEAEVEVSELKVALLPILDSLAISTKKASRSSRWWSSARLSATS
jgi:ABC-type phosphate/phosphonate transport system substrate-binding protein